MAINIKNNRHITKYITVAGENEIPKRVATITGRVTPEESMAMTFTVSSAKLALAQKNDIAAALDAFVAELRTLAADNGLPV